MGILFRPMDTADIGGLRDLLEDDGMIYHPEYLNRFFASPGACAFGAFEGKRPVGMAYCYLLPRPDGKTMFFLYSLGLLPAWQDRGIGTKFMAWLSDYAKNLGCSELFVITDKGNPRACRVYEKAGGKSEYSDEIVYVIDYEKEKTGKDEM